MNTGTTLSIRVVDLRRSRRGGSSSSVVRVSGDNDETAGDVVTRAVAVDICHSLKARREDAVAPHRRYTLTLSKSWPGHTNTMERIVEDFEPVAKLVSSGPLTLSQNPLKYAVVRTPHAVLGSPPGLVTITPEASQDLNSRLQTHFFERLVGRSSDSSSASCCLNIEQTIMSATLHRTGQILEEVEVCLTIPLGATDTAAPKESCGGKFRLKHKGTDETEFRVSGMEVYYSSNIAEGHSITLCKPQSETGSTLDDKEDCRVVTMSFPEGQRANWTCWLSSLRLGASGKAKLQTSFNHDYCPAGQTAKPQHQPPPPQPDKSAFRLFSKFGKLRMMSKRGLSPDGQPSMASSFGGMTRQDSHTRRRRRQTSANFDSVSCNTTGALSRALTSSKSSLASSGVTTASSSGVSTGSSSLPVPKSASFSVQKKLWSNSVLSGGLLDECEGGMSSEAEDDELETEEPLVAVDRTADGQFRVVTDPAKIEEIRQHEVARKRENTRLHQQLVNEPWYCCCPSDAVSDLLSRTSLGVDGYFLVRSSNFRSSAHPGLETFALVLTHGGGAVAQFRILQEPMFDKTVFSLDKGLTRFSSLTSLVEFYHYNRGPLPCLLTDYPLL